MKLNEITQKKDVVTVEPADQGTFAVVHNEKEVSQHPTKPAAEDAATHYRRRLDIEKRKQGLEEGEEEKDDNENTKQVVVSYKTGEFPISKELEQKLNARAKEMGGKETDRTMSKDNVRSLTFEMPSNKAGAFKSAANQMISSFDFSKK